MENAKGIFKCSLLKWRFWYFDFNVTDQGLISQWVITGLGNDMAPNRRHAIITYPFQNFNGCTLDGLEWISNVTPHFVMGVITSPCWMLNLKLIHIDKRGKGGTELECRRPHELCSLGRHYWAFVGETDGHGDRISMPRYYRERDYIREYVKNSNYHGHLIN